MYLFATILWPFQSCLYQQWWVSAVATVQTYIFCLLLSQQLFQIVKICFSMYVMYGTPHWRSLPSFLRNVIVSFQTLNIWITLIGKPMTIAIIKCSDVFKYIVRFKFPCEWNTYIMETCIKQSSFIFHHHFQKCIFHMLTLKIMNRPIPSTARCLSFCTTLNITKC